MKISKKRLLEIAEVLLIVILCASFAYIFVNKVLDIRSERSLKKLQDSVHAVRNIDRGITIHRDKDDPEEEPDEGTAGISGDQSESNETTLLTDRDIDYSAVAAVYKDIHDENNDFAGWLLIDGTTIDYPVMQGPDNEFYLSHNLQKTYDKYGMLVLDVKSDRSKSSPHLIIYGHNVHNGDLFGELINYKDEKYYEYHPEIIFDDVLESSTYRIFAVLRTSVEEAQESEKLFTTYFYEDEDSFKDMLSWVKERALYDMDYEPSYGDEIISLVTCEYTKENGRFVVMAAKVNEEKETKN